MPTERFFRLSEKKKSIIREAAKKEFCRVPYEKASINQIIHNANISRGSFYTYFEDKRDVVRWLFEDSCVKIETFCREQLEENHGDYFALMKSLFEMFVETIQETTEMLEMTRNVFSDQENISMMGIGCMPDPADDEGPDSPVRWMYDHVDKTCLLQGGIEYFRPLLSMSASALILAVKRYYDFPERQQLVREEYHRSLELLQRGAYRQDR